MNLFHCEYEEHTECQKDSAGLPHCECAILEATCKTVSLTMSLPQLFVASGEGDS